MSLLEARNLVKCYASVPAVSDLSFSLNPGEVLECLGPNGSGKSTTVRMLTGLIEPTRGAIFAGGTNIQRDLVKYREHLGYVPEEPELYPFLSGWEIVAHEQKVDLITKSTRKDDRHDARTLARLARIDPELLGPVRHRSAHAQIHLTMIRAQAELVRARTAFVNAARDR